MRFAFQTFDQFRTARSGWTNFPVWGRILITLAAIPGVLIGVLSILGLLVSILALLLLTVPVYKLVRSVQRMFAPRPREGVTVVDPDGTSWEAARTRQVDAKVIDP